MHYLVLGAGISGLGATKLCLSLKQKVILYDKNKQKLLSLKESNLIDKNVETCSKISKRTMHSTMCIVLSPGVVLLQKIFNFAKIHKIPIMGELEFGMKYAKGKKIAITGTNGKTTTTNLCDFVLNYAKKSSKAVGNVGVSVCDIALNTKDEDFLVCEASSFQLENAKTFHPSIACFLNFAPDHLDRYKTIDDYFNAKLHIFDNLEEEDFAVLNMDDDVVFNFHKNLKAKTVFISVKKHLENECYSAWKDGEFLFAKLNDKLFKISTNNSNLQGIHNVYNMLFAFVVCLLCGVNEKTIQQAFANFVLPNHRCEVVATKNGVKFVDDSKATNIHATLSALNSFKAPVVLLVGGSDKGEDFSRLFLNLPSNVKSVITFGDVGKKLKKIAKKCGYQSVIYEKEFEFAINKAEELAISKDVVLLSPACASFDKFKSYAERGDYFKFLITGERVE